MDLQRTLLRVLLWMLALAAAAGVMAVFISTEVMGRVAGTAFLAALACGLAMPISRRMDSETQRLGGLIGVVSVVLSFLLAVGAIWLEALFGQWQTSFRLGVTAIVVVVGGLIAGSLVRRAHKGVGAEAARAGILVDALAAGLFLSATWADSGSWDGIGTTASLAATGWFLLVTGVPGVLSMIGAGLKDRTWRLVGLAAAVLAMGIAVVGVWFVQSGDPTIFLAMEALAVTVAYANVVVRVPMGEVGVWARMLAIGSTAAAGACLTALSYLTGGFEVREAEMLARVTGAAGIVAACSTIAILILYRLNRRTPGVSRNIAEIRAVSLVCPHCGRKREAAVGETACEGCGLYVMVKVREPRCAKCDYPLLDVRGGKCPECGEKATG